MDKLKILFFVTGLFTFLSQVQGASYLWDNQEGLQKVNGCEFEDMKDIPYRISRRTGKGTGNQRYIENLRNSKGQWQSNLPIGSLVRFTDKKSKGKNTHIYVIGANRPIGKVNERKLSKRTDSGHINKKSLRSLDNFVLKLSENIRPNHDNDYKGYQFIIVSSPSYQKIICPNMSATKSRDYILFNGYREGSEPILVGVSIEETGIFKNIVSRLQSSAAKDLSIIGQDQSIDLTLDASAIKANKTKKAATKTTQKDSPTMDYYSDKGFNFGIDNVICHPSGNGLSVRDDNLERIFTSKYREEVNIFANWDGKPEIKEKESGDSIIKYVKVQFKNRESKDQEAGWVSGKYIIDISECKEKKSISSKSKGGSFRKNLAKKISGLNDPDCCDFPTTRQPTTSYTVRPRAFRSIRPSRGGALHAGCDLYRVKGERVRAIAPGKVLRRADFYGKTWQVTIKHDSGFIVRYGEILPKNAAGMRRGKVVKMGQTVGRIGVVYTRSKKTGKLRPCCKPMLHFELYSGKLGYKLKGDKGGRALSIKY